MSTAPVPSLDEWTAGFWQAAAEGRLTIQVCSNCEAPRSLPRLMCARCGSLDYGWTECSGRGCIYSFSILWRPFHPAFTDVPVVIAIVELEDFPIAHLMTRLTGDGSNVRIGDPVEVYFEPRGGVVIPQFRLI